MKKYIVKGYYNHIADRGVFYAKNLYSLVSDYNINYCDVNLEDLEKELEEKGSCLLGDYLIKIEE